MEGAERNGNNGAFSDVQKWEFARCNVDVVSGSKSNYLQRMRRNISVKYRASFKMHHANHTATVRLDQTGR